MTTAKPNVEFDDVARRGQRLKAMLEAERWTGRKVALAIGANSTYIQARLHGRVDLTYSDVAAIAPLLKMTGPELFEALEDAEKAPTPKGEGLSLPEMDSNHQPAGIKPEASIHYLAPRTIDAAERDELATIHVLRSAS